MQSDEQLMTTLRDLADDYYRSAGHSLHIKVGLPDPYFERMQEISAQLLTMVPAVREYLAKHAGENPTGHFDHDFVWALKVGTPVLSHYASSFDKTDDERLKTMEDRHSERGVIVTGIWLDRGYRYIMLRDSGFFSWGMTCTSIADFEAFKARVLGEHADAQAKALAMRAELEEFKATREKAFLASLKPRTSKPKRNDGFHVAGTRKGLQDAIRAGDVQVVNR